MAQEEVVAFHGGTLRVDFGDVPRQAMPLGRSTHLLWAQASGGACRTCNASSGSGGGSGRWQVLRTLEPETRSYKVEQAGEWVLIVFKVANHSSTTFPIPLNPFIKIIKQRCFKDMWGWFQFFQTLASFELRSVLLWNITNLEWVRSQTFWRNIPSHCQTVFPNTVPLYENTSVGEHLSPLHPH